MSFDPDRHGRVAEDESVEAWEAPSVHRRIRLLQGGAIVLEPDGFRLIETRGLKRSPLHPYESLCHVDAAERLLLIGTSTGLHSIRRSDFPDPENGPEEARRLLLERLAARPDGPHYLERMARVEALGVRNHRPYAIWATVLLCLIGTALQLRDPMVEQIGAFMPDLFERGEWWRATTAHFLHGLPTRPGFFGFLPWLPGLPIHLAVNVAGLFVLGNLVERPLGTWRTLLVLALGGIGTVIGILVAGHVEVIGASGLVSALAGAILAIELHFPESIPSYWRLPRRLFITVIIVQFLILDPLFGAYLAGGAHLGGFVGGYVAAWWLGRPSLEGLVPSTRIRFAAYCAVTVLVVGILGAMPLARREMNALERHGARLLNTPAAFYLYQHDNAAAWFIATGDEPSPYGLELAVALADRAVATTGQMHPGILDTLAEALFQSGDRLGALVTIDQAIRLVPHESYFIEQRRRFSGERAPDDRPPEPGSEPKKGSPFSDDFEAVPIDPDAPRLTI